MKLKGGDRRREAACCGAGAHGPTSNGLAPACGVARSLNRDPFGGTVGHFPLVKNEEGSYGRGQTDGDVPTPEGCASVREHVPMAVKQLAGKTKLVATKVQGSPQGKPAFYRIAEVHFPSLEALQACAASAGGKETLAHAAKISTGGAPVVLIAEEQTFTF